MNMFAPNPVAFTIFGRNIYWYGIIIAVAVLLGILLAYREAKRKGHNPDMVMDLALLAIPMAIVFARAYYVIFEWERYASNPISALYIWEGGIAIYGAVIGGVLALLIFARWKKLSFWELADITAPSLVLGQALGRWGNFFNQEAFGYAVTNPSLQWFPFAVYIQNLENSMEGPWHYATFFYESMACLLIFVFLMWYRKRSKREGNVFLWYLLLYGIERAFVEGLRTDSLYLGMFRVSQLLSIALVILAGVVLLVRRRKAVFESAEVDPNLVMVRRSSFDDDDESGDALRDGDLPPAQTDAPYEESAEGESEETMELVAEQAIEEELENEEEPGVESTEPLPELEEEPQEDAPLGGEEEVKEENENA